jgi:alpha-ketoglutarate-dependent taurine dioxygenase
MSVADAIAIEKIAGPTFGARVTGVRVTDMDDATFSRIREKWVEHKLLVFPGQHLTRDEQVAFAQRFGELEIDLTELTNVRSDGTICTDEKEDLQLLILKGNFFWHCDSTFIPLQAKAGVLSARAMPSVGGETEWTDLAAAYDALDPAMQARVQGLEAYHSVVRSSAKVHAYFLGEERAAALASERPPETGPYANYGRDVAPPLRPLVKHHPETGRLSLNIGRHAYHVTGMSEEDSEVFLGELMDFAARPPRVYTHKWTVGDLVVFDNRCLAHRVRPWKEDEARVMLNSRVAGDPATETALSAA